MAEKDSDAVWNHIVDLHKKHSELALQMHDKQGASQEGADEHLGVMKELLTAIKELTAAVKDDAKADRGEANGKRGSARGDALQAAPKA